MPSTVNIYQCDSGLVITKKALIHRRCDGCCFATFRYNEGRRKFDACLRGGGVPSCERSLIYTRLRGK